MTPTEGVIISTVIAGIFAFAGVLYSSRGNAKAAMSDTMVKAYQAVTEENERLRAEDQRKSQRISDLEQQLARAYSHLGRGGAGQ